MQLHLFSTPGEPLLHDLVHACRTGFAGVVAPLVAYLPAAADGPLWTEATREAFKGVADVRLIDLDRMDQSEIEATLDEATLLYIPGGNTYRLSQRVRQCGLIESLKRRISGGLSLAAFSAGTVYCGQDILTTNDVAEHAMPQVGGLALTRFNFHVHYPAEVGPEQRNRDARLKVYHARHRHPVLALEDGAYLRIVDNDLELVAGGCWRFDAGQARRRLELGPIT